VVEVFSNPSAQSLAQAQAQTFVQDVTVKTDGTGSGSFSLSVPNGFYTATATDPSGNTSQLSVAVGPLNLPASATALNSSANPSTAGQSVTFTAVVTAPGYQGTPTGTVTFTIDGHAQTPVALAVVGGVDEAQFSTSTLTVGSHTVSAAYGGDSNVSSSSGNLPSQTVTASTLPVTTTTLTSSANPSTVGQQVTFTAAVTASGYQGTPTGTVIFTIDGHAQTPVALAVVGGVDEAQFSTSTLTVGPHSIGAAYSGDATVNPSTGSLPIQTVRAASPPPTVTTLSTATNPATVGQPVSFAAIVSSSTSAGTPTGTVTFTIDGKAQAPVPLEILNGRDEAVFAISTLSAGKHTVSAQYNGGVAFAASPVSNVVTETVNASSVDPPTVVSLERFGIHMQPTVLLLNFSSALDPTRAQDVRNYRIVSPCGKRIAIDSAVYDAALHTVTIRPHVRLNFHRNFRFTVYGSGSYGVATPVGILLDGAGNGKPGSNYFRILNRSELVVPSSPAKKPLHARAAIKPARALHHQFVSRSL
jgi:hypothetical protein